MRHIKLKRILAVSLMVVLFLLLTAVPFVLKVSVVCKSQYGSCSPEIFDGLRSANGKSWFSAARLIKKQLKGEPLVSDFSIQFRLPSNLVVNVISKKPFFALYSTKSQKAALIDPNGYVLTIEGETNLPKVVISGDLPESGQVVSSQILDSLKIVYGVFEMYQVGTATVESDSLTVELPAQIKVLFPLEGSDPQVLLGTLRLIYNRITGDTAKKYSQIDLRFKNPVLR